MFHPIRKIKEFWTRLVTLEAKLIQLEYRIEDAEEVAYRKASYEFEQRTKQLQAYNTMLMEKIVEISNLTPLIIREDKPDGQP